MRVAAKSDPYSAVVAAGMAALIVAWILAFAVIWGSAPLTEGHEQTATSTDPLN